MLSPDVVRSFFCTSLSSRDFWTAVAERFADASASDTDAALATTDRSSRSVSGVPATLALPPTLIPGLPLAGYQRRRKGQGGRDSGHASARPVRCRERRIGVRSARVGKP